MLLCLFALAGYGFFIMYKNRSALENSENIKNIVIVGRNPHYTHGYIGRSINPGRCTKVKYVKDSTFDLQVNYKDGTSRSLFISENSTLWNEIIPFLTNPEKLYYNRMDH